MRSHAFLALVALIISPVSCANAFQQDPAKEAFYSGEQRSGDETRVPEEHRDTHPAFLANRSVAVDGAVGDLFAGGETIAITGHVQGNAFVGGRTVRLTGRIDGDLFFFGETVHIAGELRGDLYGFFQEVRVLDTGVVGGDVYVAGERAWIEGRVAGRVVGAGQRINILGSVGQDLFVACERLEIHEGASIGGDVLYDSPDEPVIRDESAVSGRIERVEYHEKDVDVEFGGRQGSLFWDLLGVAVLFFSSLLIGVVLLLAGGASASRPAALLSESPALGLGVGFVAFVVVPILSVFLCFLPPAGLLFMVLFGVAVFLARLVTAQCLGSWLLGKLGAGAAHPVLGLMVGLIIYYAITAIPYLGNLVWFAWVISGLGGMVLAVRRARTS